MNIATELKTLGLNPDNCVVIGSGILSALGIRESGDIDVVASKHKYDSLSKLDRFKMKVAPGREMLDDGLFEIGTSWGVMDKDQTFEDLSKNSIMIDGVRYITIEFLLNVKKSWLQDDDVRQKDINDVALISAYLSKP